MLPRTCRNLNRRAAVMPVIWPLWQAEVCFFAGRTGLHRLL